MHFAVVLNATVVLIFSTESPSAVTTMHHLDELTKNKQSELGSSCSFEMFLAMRIESSDFFIVINCKYGRVFIKFNKNSVESQASFALYDRNRNPQTDSRSSFENNRPPGRLSYLPNSHRIIQNNQRFIFILDLKQLIKPGSILKQAIKTMMGKQEYSPYFKVDLSSIFVEATTQVDSTRPLPFLLLPTDKGLSVFISQCEDQKTTYYADRMTCVTGICNQRDVLPDERRDNNEDYRLKHEAVCLRGEPVEMVDTRLTPKGYDRRNTGEDLFTIRLIVSFSLVIIFAFILVCFVSKYCPQILSRFFKVKSSSQMIHDTADLEISRISSSVQINPICVVAANARQDVLQVQQLYPIHSLDSRERNKYQPFEGLTNQLVKREGDGGLQQSQSQKQQKLDENETPTPENRQFVSGSDLIQEKNIEEICVKREGNSVNIEVSSLIDSSQKTRQLLSSMQMKAERSEEEKEDELFIQMMEDNLQKRGDIGKGAQRGGFLVISESNIQRQASNLQIPCSVHVPGAAAAAESHQLRQFQLALKKQYGISGNNRNNYFEIAASILSKVIVNQPVECSQSRVKVLSEDDKEGQNLPQGDVYRKAVELLLQQPQMSKDLCRNCKTRKKDCVLDSCGHRMCQDCAESSKADSLQCPFCSIPINLIIPTYDP